jgi:hypothetical protein
MALKQTQISAESDLFRQELVNIIDLRHALLKLGERIDWSACEARFGSLYAAGVGRAGHPVRLMVGLQMLKQIYYRSDVQVVATWVENPYWQCFCSEQYFNHALPIDISHANEQRAIRPRSKVSTPQRSNASPRARSIGPTSLASKRVSSPPARRAS